MCVLIKVVNVNIGKLNIILLMVTRLSLLVSLGMVIFSLFSLNSILSISIAFSVTASGLSSEQDNW